GAARTNQLNRFPPGQPSITGLGAFWKLHGYRARDPAGFVCVIDSGAQHAQFAPDSPFRPSALFNIPAASLRSYMRYREPLEEIGQRQSRECNAPRCRYLRSSLLKVKIEHVGHENCGGIARAVPPSSALEPFGEDDFSLF